VRVSLDMTTLTIMRCVLLVATCSAHSADEALSYRILPREVDPLVYNMSMEDPNGATFAGIGGLGDQIRELREVSRCYIS
jgi:26S proteasome regulatory subunit T4